MLKKSVLILLATLFTSFTSVTSQADPTYYKMLINGKLVDSESGRTREIRDPANNELIAVVPEGTQKDAELAIHAAREAFDEGPWSQMDHKEREILLKKIANSIREKAEMLAQLEVRNNGKPLAEARGD